MYATDSSSSYSRQACKMLAPNPPKFSSRIILISCEPNLPLGAHNVENLPLAICKVFEATLALSTIKLELVQRRRNKECALSGVRRGAERGLRDLLHLRLNGLRRLGRWGRRVDRKLGGSLNALWCLGVAKHAASVVCKSHTVPASRTIILKVQLRKTARPARVHACKTRCDCTHATWSRRKSRFPIANCCQR